MLTVSWQPWADEDPAPLGYNLANLGGSKDDALTWPDYLTQYPAEWHPHLEAVRQSIIKQGIWVGGDWHQNDAHGMPVVGDGHHLAFSWRGWGGLLAAVWNSELGQQFTYMDFYMAGRLPPTPSSFARRLGAGTSHSHTPTAGTTPLDQS